MSISARSPDSPRAANRKDPGRRSRDFANQLRHVGNRADRNHLKKTTHHRFSFARLEQGVNQLEGDADTQRFLSG
jgi:hypothetical protein